MTILYLKSILSIFMALGVLINVFTMFEAFGRNERRYNLATLKRVHRINGLIFILLYLFITYFCFHSVLSSQAELSPRATFHAVFALAVIVLLAMKIAFIEFYPQFSGKIMTIGPTVALLAFGASASCGNGRAHGSCACEARFAQARMPCQAQRSSAGATRAKNESAASLTRNQSAEAISTGP